VFGQSASTPNESKAAPPVSSRDQKPQADDYGLGLGTHGRQEGVIEILSDPLGVDFGPYLRQLHKDVKKKWLKGIHESEKVRKGKLAIEFAIRKDGDVAEMKLVATSGDVALAIVRLGTLSEHPIRFTLCPASSPGLTLRYGFAFITTQRRTT
jgi:hypothetical protein